MRTMFLGIVLALGLAGCVHIDKGNKGQLQSYFAPPIEPEWIRNGEAIVYDNNQWYPERDVENLLDSEVYQIGEQNGTQIFVEKIDIKPYARLYTKFANNKFRYYLRRHD